jgi:hypothetical protein
MSWSSMRRNLLISFVVFMFAGSLAWAQNVGSLDGNVLDPTGANVGGATVKLIDLANNSPRLSKTNATGEFGFAQINPGMYRLEVSKDGFKTHVEEHVAVVVATPTHVEIRLELGNVAQQILVESAAVPQLNTQDATVGNPFEEHEVKSLPFLARNVINLLTLQPGVVFTGESNTDRLSQGSINTLDPREGAVDGVRGNQGNVTVDGIDANDWQNQAAFTSALPVTLDSVQEFRVTTTNANATDGIVGGAQVSLVTKSGSDSFHGNVRWYYRTSGTASNDFFNNAQNPQIPRGKDQRNIPGGSLGGPILKDRLFFFVDTEERREIVSASLLTPRQVPSDALKDGVLVYACAPILDAMGNVIKTPAQVCPAGPPVQGMTTTHNIPVGDFGLTPAQFQAADPAGLGINPAIITYFKQFPEGNTPSAGIDGGLSFIGLNFNFPESTKNNIYTSRLDYILTRNGHHTIFAKGVLQGLKTDLTGPQFPGGTAASQLLNNSRGIAVQYQGQFTPSIINTVRYGLTRIGVQQSGTVGAEFNIRSFSNIAPFATRPQGRTVPVHEVNDDLSWTRGKHTFAFGGAIYFVRNHNINDLNSFPFFGVNNGFCTNLCEDFNLANANAPAPSDITSFVRAFTGLTGSITQVNATVFATPQSTFLPPGSPEERHFAENLYEAYAQDSWKIRSNVTLTLGLRYGYEAPPYETNGFQVAPTVDIGQWFRQREINSNLGIASNVSPLLSWALAGKANHGANSFYHPNNADFAPRVALAYAPKYDSGLLGSIFGNGKSALRLGAGLFYDRIGQALTIDADQNGSPGTATALIDGSQQFSLATAPRFSGTCTPTGCTGLPAAGPPFFPIPANAQFPFTPDGNLADQAPNLGFAVDPHLKTPYTIHLTASFQRQLPKGVVLDVAYVGTLGRRLLGKADFAQYENLRDPKSGVDLFTAYRQIAKIANVGPATSAAIAPQVAVMTSAGTFNEPNVAALSAIQAIPYFSNLLPNMPAFDAAALCSKKDPMLAQCQAGYMSLSPTQAFYAFTTVNSGAAAGGSASWSCALFALDTTQVAKGRPSPWNTTLDPNGTGFVLFQQQFSQLDAWTNWANSNYHSLQVSVKRNVGFGTFAFNYVFSKSIDNASSPENADNIPGLNGTAEGLIQNPFDLRLNRAVSNFNLKHNFNGSAVIALPFGHGHRFASGGGRLEEALVGGWEVANVFRWRSGFPLEPGNGFNFPTNFFLTSAGTLLAPLQTSLTRAVSGANVAPGLTPGLANIFSNPGAALNDITFALPGLPGSRNTLVGPAYAEVDMGVHKSFKLWKEGTSLQFRITAFNLFNSVNFNDGAVSLDPTSPATFGLITQTANSAAGIAVGRDVEFAIRLEF